MDALRDVGENGISALAPVAVLPYFQGKGAGKAVISSELELCKEASCDLVLGDPGYYRRFGFSTELAKDLESPYSGEYFMALRLTEEVTLARGSGPLSAAIRLRDLDEPSSGHV